VKLNARLIHHARYVRSATVAAFGALPQLTADQPGPRPGRTHLVVSTSIVQTLSHHIPPSAVGATVTVTLSPIEEGSEVLRLRLLHPADALNMDPTASYAAWLAESEESGYLNLSKDLDKLIRQVEDGVCQESWTDPRLLIMQPALRSGTR
jgi:hypothetical protein